MQKMAGPRRVGCEAQAAAVDKNTAHAVVVISSVRRGPYHPRSFLYLQYAAAGVVGGLCGLLLALFVCL